MTSEVPVKRSTVLLVDDDESLRDVLKRNLEKLKHHVTTAENGKAGLERFIKGDFDVVISDIRMPEMDGIELLRQIRLISKTPVILITGFSELLETHSAHELGANEFLSKPFERTELEHAITRCITQHKSEDPEVVYSRVSISDFLSGRQIVYSVFMRLSESKYVKIARKGEDLSVERIKLYRDKGISHLYLLRDDFRKYIGFSLKMNQSAQGNAAVSRERKLNLAKHTAELLMTHIGSHGLDKELLADASSFVESCVDTVSEDGGLCQLLEVLKDHSDYHFAHSIGVSFYSVALARSVGWTLPSNQFIVALAGLMHDIGEKEIPLEILKKPRSQWSSEESKQYERHPLQGVDILGSIPSVPEDILQIVKQHHEDCLAQGFPARLKKTQLHPMAKMISVADHFCELVIPNSQNPGIKPSEALKQMNMLYSERLDRQFFRALKQILNFEAS
jgi:response regulator RpfG family c-di-GMP phosphodiesterase